MRDVAALAVAALPDGEAEQAQPLQVAVGEVHFDVGELAIRLTLVVRHDLDHHSCVLQ